MKETAQKWKQEKQINYEIKKKELEEKVLKKQCQFNKKLWKKAVYIC